MVDKEIKKRRISRKDWDSVAVFVRTELEKRKQDKFRKHHENIWREVDRMINMEPMRRYNKDGTVVDEEWRSVIELGELAKASEIITADVMRLTFPTTKAWFEAHSEIDGSFDPSTGEIAQAEQEFNDKALRALMVQQHLDFGLKPRYELSVKEALHHGSYVAEIVMENRTRIHEGTHMENTKAPVWKPYSMWNAYPDPAPSVVGTDMFYTGSMMLVDYIPLMHLKEIAKGDGWITSNVSRVEKKDNKDKDAETQDVELVKYYGDVEIKRQDGTIYLPNSKVILANDILVYYSPVDLAYPPIVYSGYERMDVRDPYYSSPLMKMVPLQKMASQLANKYIDNVWMRIEPPIVYDGNDPEYVMNGGPVVAPGSKTATKNGAEFKEVKVGEPEQALQGLQMAIQQLQQGLGVNAIRSGAGNDVSDKTATEINTSEAKAEIRTAEFVEKQERTALRPFLYMQHEYNKKAMGKYSFYNPEKDAPDFMRVTQKQLPDVVHFEIVGSSGVLGEQRRSQAMAEITALLLGNEYTSHLPKTYEIAKQLYQDGGVKNPERFLNKPEGNPEVDQLKEEAQMIIDELQAKLQEEVQKNEEKMFEAQKKMEIEQFKAESEMAIKKFEAEQKAMIQEFLAQAKADAMEMQESHKRDIQEIKSKELPATMIDSSQIGNLNSTIGSIDKVVKSMMEVANQNNAALKQELANSLDELRTTLGKEKSVKVKRDKQGKITGATVH